MTNTMQHYLSADRPVSKLDEDRLDRSGYARAIARSISTWKGDESLVLALYGGWGDGKSSVLGMVVDALRQDEAGCPLIVEFNPWEWAGQNQLAQVFFEEIGKQIAEEGTARSAPHAQETGSRMRALGKYLSFGASLAKVAKYAPVLARALNSVAGTPESQAQIEGTIAAVEPYADTVAQAGSAALEEAAKISEQGAEAGGQSTTKESLRNVKAALAADLKKLGKNVLVVLDDVDRLAADEIRLLFQLVKANSDFPNLIFLLAFQRDIVEAALEKTIGTGSGRDYLEKIVQVPLNLPEIQRPLLERFLSDRLGDLLKRRDLESVFDWPRFKELWASGLSVYFQNLRDVLRFLGTFEFQIGVFTSPVEFNAVDLFALETLRLFEANLYRQIVVSRPLLLPGDFTQIHYDVEKLDLSKPWADAISQVVNLGKPANPDAGKALLEALFPTEFFACGWKAPERLRGIQREARVAHPSFFSRYFSLCVPQGDVSQVELMGLKGAMGTPDDFKHRLVALDRSGLALAALDRLLAYAEAFNPESAEPFALALYDTADVLVGKYSECLWTGLAAVSCSLVDEHLAKVNSQAKRFSILKDVFEKTTGVYLPACQAKREWTRVEEFKKKDEPRGFSRKDCAVLEDEQLNQLASICLKRFSEAAKSGVLKTHPCLNEVLSLWWAWSRGSNEPKDYFRELSETDDGLLVLLERFLGKRVGGESRFVDRLFDRGLSDFEPLADVNAFRQRVERALKGDLSPRQRELCRTFLALHDEHVRNQRLFPQPAPQAQQGVPPATVSSEQSEAGDEPQAP